MGSNGLARLVLIAAIAGGISYIAAWNMDLPLWLDAAWKGSCVGLLAVFAALQARSTDGWLISAVMALGMGGDVLLEVASLQVGAVSFLIGHLMAIWLYARNAGEGWRRGLPLAAVFVIAVAAFSWSLPPDRAGAPGVALYATGLAAMAAAACLSTFPRHLVALGALMFVASDLFLFARLGPLKGQEWANFAVWGLYIGGQILIAVGVTQALRARDIAMQ
jgi:uncharacterized membrane protein YhhN